MRKLPLFPASIVGSIPRPLVVRELIEKAHWDETDAKSREVQQAAGVQSITADAKFVADYKAKTAPLEAEWVKKAEVNSGKRAGVPTEVADKVKALEREVRELRQANEILRKASAYFAQAELDRPFRR